MFIVHLHTRDINAIGIFYFVLFCLALSRVFKEKCGKLKYPLTYAFNQSILAALTEITLISLPKEIQQSMQKILPPFYCSTRLIILSLCLNDCPQKGIRYYF